MAAQRRPAGRPFTIEFVALANHRKAIRAEIARYAERHRAAQLEAHHRRARRDGVEPDQLPPVVALLMMTGLTQVMALEEALGVTAGHEATVAFIGTLDHGARRPAAGAAARPGDPTFGVSKHRSAMLERRTGHVSRGDVDVVDQ